MLRRNTKRKSRAISAKAADGQIVTELFGKPTATNRRKTMEILVSMVNKLKQKGQLLQKEKGQNEDKKMMRTCKLLFSFLLISFFGKYYGQNNQDSLLEQFLVKNFEIGAKKKCISSDIKAQYYKRYSERFVIANPEQKFNSTDLVDIRYPLRRLIFVSSNFSGNMGFVYYEVGGNGRTTVLLIYCKSESMVRFRTYDAGKKILSFSELREQISKGNLRVMD